MAVHRLGTEEHTLAGRAAGTDELEVVGEPGLGPLGDMHRIVRTTFRIEPVGLRDRLDQGGLAGTVLADEHGHRGEVETVVEQVTDGGDGGRPAAAVGGVDAQLLDPADREGKTAEHGSQPNVRGRVGAVA
ncbi:hypothetical protein [Corynebacterium nuruki]|nr:hypothetical protein [Corynebacterium nuruki]